MAVTEKRRKAFERAYEIQHKLVKDYPDSSIYRHDLSGICYFSTVEYATLVGADHRDGIRARELVREDLEIEPENAAYWKALALAEYRAGDLDAALKAGTKTLEIRKNNGYSYDWLLLALIHLGRGDREQARLWAARLLRGVPPGTLTSEDGDFVRLARENEGRLRALLDPAGAGKPLKRE